MSANVEAGSDELRNITPALATELVFVMLLTSAMTAPLPLKFCEAKLN